MSDLLSEIKMVPRFTARTQTNLNRAAKNFSELPGNLNIHNLIRIKTMNPQILICSLLLLDAGIEEEPEIIRERKEFHTLLDVLNIRSSNPAYEAKNMYKASLILMEVFVHMILVQRARSKNYKSVEKEDDLI